MASKEDPAVQFWEFVQENLLQVHCENVSWEQASDKIPIKVVVELLGVFDNPCQHLLAIEEQ